MALISSFSSLTNKAQRNKFLNIKVALLKPSLVSNLVVSATEFKPLVSSHPPHIPYRKEKERRRKGWKRKKKEKREDTRDSTNKYSHQKFNKSKSKVVLLCFILHWLYLFIAFFTYLVPCPKPHNIPSLFSLYQLTLASITTDFYNNVQVLFSGLETLAQSVIRHPVLQALPKPAFYTWWRKHMTSFMWRWDSWDADQDHWVPEFTIVHSPSLANRVHFFDHKAVHFPNILVGTPGRWVLQNLCYDL